MPSKRNHKSKSKRRRKSSEKTKSSSRPEGEPKRDRGNSKVTRQASVSRRKSNRKKSTSTRSSGKSTKMRESQNCKYVFVDLESQSGEPDIKKPRKDSESSSLCCWKVAASVMGFSLIISIAATAFVSYRNSELKALMTSQRSDAHVQYSPIDPTFGMGALCDDPTLFGILDSKDCEDPPEDGSMDSLEDPTAEQEETEESVDPEFPGSAESDFPQGKPEKGKPLDEGESKSLFEKLKDKFTRQKKPSKPSKRGPRSKKASESSKKVPKAEEVLESPKESAEVEEDSKDTSEVEDCQERDLDNDIEFDKTKLDFELPDLSDEKAAKMKKILGEKFDIEQLRKLCKQSLSVEEETEEETAQKPTCSLG